MLWRAVYNDGSDLWETPGRGSGEIDRDRCIRIELTEGGVLKVGVDIPIGGRAVYRHRVVQDLSSGEVSSELWIVGYTYRAAGGPSATLCYLYPDGTCNVQNDVRDIELLDVEQP